MSLRNGFEPADFLKFDLQTTFINSNPTVQFFNNISYFFVQCNIQLHIKLDTKKALKSFPIIISFNGST